MSRPLATAWKAMRKGRDFLAAQALFATLSALRLLPPRLGLSAADAISRRIGPLTPRHRVTTENLRLAYPDMDAGARARLAIDNWGEMGRLAAEYVFLDQMFDYVPGRAGPGLIEVEGAAVFEDLRARRGPFILFTAHLGCFELLPICAAAFGLKVTALFRPPNNRYVARRVLAARRTRSGDLVPSKAGAVWTLVGELERGGAVGMLVDQKFGRGAATTFFGRPCRTNPLVPKLARQFGCEVYPARAIRLPGGRHRLELLPRLELPRGPDGGIDVDAACQTLNDVVEGWVREHPAQWMWFHRRWKL